MELQVIANGPNIINAINKFNASYHTDYFSVRCLAKSYLAVNTENTANSLAVTMHDVLKRWGAERQKAPTRKSLTDLTKALTDPELHALLCRFAHLPLTNLTFNAQAERQIIGHSLRQFDEDLIRALNLLANGFFTNNTNVTYPMKALLLITGFMPALDSQVKGGLYKAGFSGVNATQFLLPGVNGGVNAKKICALPFYMGSCFTKYSEIINNSISMSNYPALKGEIGRVFDVLLFVQESCDISTLELQHPKKNWY